MLFRKLPMNVCARQVKTDTVIPEVYADDAVVIGTSCFATGTQQKLNA